MNRWGSKLVILGAGVLLAASLLAPAGAHVNNNVGHLFNKHIKPLLAKAGSINASSNPID